MHCNGSGRCALPACLAHCQPHNAGLGRAGLQRGSCHLSLQQSCGTRSPRVLTTHATTAGICTGAAALLLCDSRDGWDLAPLGASQLAEREVQPPRAHARGVQQRLRRSARVHTRHCVVDHARRAAKHHHVPRPQLHRLRGRLRAGGQGAAVRWGAAPAWPVYACAPSYSACHRHTPCTGGCGPPQPCVCSLTLHSTPSPAPHHNSCTRRAAPGGGCGAGLCQG